MVPKTNFRSLLVIHGAVTLALSLLTLSVFKGIDHTSFLIGQGFVWVSLISIGVMIYFYFLKKNIALTVGIIVLKWPILVYLVYQLTERMSLNFVTFALGFLPIFLSSVIWSVTQKE